MRDMVVLRVPRRKVHPVAAWAFCPSGLHESIGPGKEPVGAIVAPGCLEPDNAEQSIQETPVPRWTYISAAAPGTTRFRKPFEPRYHLFAGLNTARLSYDTQVSASEDSVWAWVSHTAGRRTALLVAEAM